MIQVKHAFVDIHSEQVHSGHGFSRCVEEEQILQLDELNLILLPTTTTAPETGAIQADQRFCGSHARGKKCKKSIISLMMW